MKILALIPARGGSKRFPRKNIKLLGGVPLIAWTIRAAKASGVCTDVLVSTDDAEIANVAKANNALILGSRPAELATDTASSVDVALHELAVYEKDHGKVDGLLLLQPTSPFRTADNIREAVDLFNQTGGGRPIVSVSPVASHPAWSFRIIGGNTLDPVMGWDSIKGRAQDLEPIYMLNGAIYIICPLKLRSERKFVTLDVVPYVMSNPKEVIDIDEEIDFEFSEFLINNR